MNIPADLKYTSSHEWVRAEADGTISIGITEHAQELLGDLVFIELPGLESEFVAGQEAAVVESVKAAADVYAPLDGNVVDVNKAAVEEHATATKAAQPDSLFRMRPNTADDLATLLDAAAYQMIVDAA